MRIVCFLFAAMLLCSIARAQTITWSADDSTGAKVVVPLPDKPSVLAFVRADQQQSRQTLDEIKSIVADRCQVVVIVSGELAVNDAKALADATKRVWPVVADPDFKSSGQLGVHVWPTTVVVNSGGVVCAHLAGSTNNLVDYVDFAGGKIDQASLDQRLAKQTIVADAPAAKASRHLLVAQRLIEHDQLDEARDQLDAGLKLAPDDSALKCAMISVLCSQRDFSRAGSLLESLAPGSIPPATLGLLRGRVLIGFEKWDDARLVLEDSLKLNPDPAETHYLLGTIYQHANDFQRAAESFRKAYESREKKH